MVFVGFLGLGLSILAICQSMECVRRTVLFFGHYLALKGPSRLSFCELLRFFPPKRPYWALEVFFFLELIFSRLLKQALDCPSICCLQQKPKSFRFQQLSKLVGWLVGLIVLSCCRVVLTNPTNKTRGSNSALGSRR